MKCKDKLQKEDLLKKRKNGKKKINSANEENDLKIKEDQNNYEEEIENLKDDLRE